MTSAPLGIVGKQTAMVVWTALTLLPFIFIFIFSFRDNIGMFTSPFGIGGTYRPENYIQAWNGAPGSVGMLQLFANSSVAALVGLVVNVLVGSTAAFYAVRLGGKAYSFVIFSFLFAQIVPFILLVVPYFQIFSALSLLNNPAVLGVAYAALSMPTTVLILAAYYQDFPEELLEAATVDGLGDFSTYVRIVLPLSKGALTAVGMLCLVYVWGEVQLAIVLLQQTQAQTVTVGILGFQGQFRTDYGPVFAALSMASVPVIVLYLTFSRFVTKGIALGGVFR